MEKTELDEVVRLHRMWFHAENGGKRANLRGCDLNGSNLIGCNLSGANLRGAKLRGADLRGSNLSGSDLSGSYLRDADLRCSNLSGSDLSGSYLIGANLIGANLSEANLSGADTGEARFIQASGVGTKRRMTTFRSDTDEVWFGCFNGTLSEFAEEIKKTHGENPAHLAHYLAMVAFFRVFAEVKCTPVTRAERTI